MLQYDMYQEYNSLNVVTVDKLYNTYIMKTIQTEYEGVQTATSLEDLIDFLCNMAEIARGVEDFVRKVTTGVTDETSHLSQADQQTLRDWYFEEYPKILQS